MGRFTKVYWRSHYAPLPWPVIRAEGVEAEVITYLMAAFMHTGHSDMGVVHECHSRVRWRVRCSVETQERCGRVR